MPAQTSPISGNQNDEKDFIENERTLKRYYGHKLVALNLFGSSDISTIKEYTQDHAIQSDITFDEMDGIAADSDVPTNIMSPEQSYNHLQLLVIKTGVRFDATGKAIPGMLGNLSKQQRDTMVRAMRIINNQLMSNVPSRKMAKAAQGGDPVKGRAGSPITFFDTSIDVAASGSAVETTKGGYAANSRITQAWNDETPSASRGQPQYEHLFDAIQTIDENYDGAAEPSASPSKKMGTFFAFIPSKIYNKMHFQSMNGISSINRIYTEDNGKPQALQLDIKVLKTEGYGTIILVLARKQVAPANHVAGLPFVCAGDATKVLYKRRGYFKDLNDSETEDRSVYRAAFTFAPPHAKAGVVLTGAKQG